MARRCPCGKPQVIQTGPVLDDGTPFPTFWWLSCKRLVAEVGRLESEGLIREVNVRLVEEPGLRQELQSSTLRLLRERDGKVSGEPPRHPGGGPDRVKCLHAHLAHHLVTGDNPVGQMVIEALLANSGDPRSARPEPCV